MKKIILLIAVLFVSMVTKAQYIGSQYLNGSLDYIVDQNQVQGSVGFGKVYKSFKVGAVLNYRNLSKDAVTANTATAGAEFSYYLLKGSRFSLSGVAVGSIGFQKAKTKSELIRLERSKAFVYGYEVGVRPEFLLSPKCALFMQYKFEMLFNSIIRNNNHIGAGFIVYL
ncbi:hypothetical protein [Parabacteroides distasonis]|uniref:Outer membrane protein beta-barrel domain-containing protein n=1 Tax=Parabacteroides distasonis TaxID=823 RepID=A0A4S2EHX7_PARDI|nr:hypothetical protein [Parabacteroides distasonis]TGY55576.1 hypothetical protein E5342_14010 [Parabacteroides distasonis]